jgi:hypothetical protein
MMESEGSRATSAESFLVLFFKKEQPFLLSYRLDRRRLYQGEHRSAG